MTPSTEPGHDIASRPVLDSIQSDGITARRRLQSPGYAIEQSHLSSHRPHAISRLPAKATYACEQGIDVSLLNPSLSLDMYCKADKVPAFPAFMDCRWFLVG